MALSLALAMGLSLVACGDKKEETTTEATTTEATTTEAAATDDATADDASASNAEVSLPMPAEDSDQSMFTHGTQSLVTDFSM